MKIHTPFFAGAIIGVLMLSACTEGTETTTMPATTSTGTVNLQPGQQPAGRPETATPIAPIIAPPVVARSEADMAAFNSAQQLNDSTFCDKIKEEAFIKDCKTELSDNSSMLAAFTKLDETLCDKLSTADKKEACKINIQAEVQKNKLRTEREASIAKDYKLMNEINLSGDLKRCAELTDTNFIYACEMNIIVNKAIQAKDVKLCDSGSTDKVRQDCVTNAKSAIDAGSNPADATTAPGV